MPYKKGKTLHHSRVPKKPFLIGGVLLLLAVLTVAALEFSSTTHWLHSESETAGSPHSAAAQSRAGTDHSKPSSGSTDSVKGSTTPAGDKTDDGNTTSTSPVLPGSGSSSSGELVAPYGQFVNFHNPASLDAKEQSVCSTSAGASCTISFTMGSTTKSLPAKTADGSGAAIWTSWTPRSIGLSKGTWTITARATAGNQTKATEDSTKLVIP